MRKKKKKKLKTLTKSDNNDKTMDKPILLHLTLKKKSENEKLEI